MKVLKIASIALGLAFGAGAVQAATWTETGGCSVTATTPNASDCFGFVDGNIQSHFDANTDMFDPADDPTDADIYTGLFEYTDWYEIQRDGDYTPNSVSGTLTIDSNTAGMVAVLLKSANEWSAYLFEGGLSGALDFTTDNGHGLSNYLVLGRSPSEVPLPAAGFLLLAGLGALSLMRRRA